MTVVIARTPAAGVLQCGTLTVHMAVPSVQRSPQVLDRYVILEEIASGGMATVHVGRLVGAAGFARPVAIKRLHTQYARDPEFVSMLIDEARVAARVLHPNVVATLDVVSEGPELFLVMEYVAGASLSTLLDAVRARNERIPPEIAVSVLIGTLLGLHAAHEATTERGEPLGIVHRDVSPQNVLIGLDGIARVHDFGIAKAVGRVQTTREGQLKGKLRYMAPEQLRGEEVTRQTDLYSAAVVLWEVLTGHRLFTAENDAALFGKVLEGVVVPPSARVPDLPPTLDGVLVRALDRDPARRFKSARDMALVLEEAVRPATTTEVGGYVERMLGPEVTARARRAADPTDGWVGDDAPTLPQPESGPIGPMRHSVHTETAPRALPAGLLAKHDEPLSSRPRSVPPTWGGADSKTRTETVQRIMPFSLPPASSPQADDTARALSATVRPQRRALGALAVFGVLAVALLGFAGISSLPDEPALLATGLVDARALFAWDPPADPVQEIQLDAVPVAGDADKPAPGRRWRPPRKSKKTKPEADCKQLYYTDSTGIRRVKRECL